MSGKSTDQKSELQPRKKKGTKRKANSPLADTGQTGSQNIKGQQAGRGKNRNNSQNVNIADNTRFSFLDTCSYTASPYPIAMNFPQQGQLQPQTQQQTVANKEHNNHRRRTSDHFLINHQPQNREQRHMRTETTMKCSTVDNKGVRRSKLRLYHGT